MSGKVKLDLALLQETIPAFKNAVHADFIDKVKTVARLIQESGDNNPVSEQLLESSANLEKVYNSLLSGMRISDANLNEVLDLTEFQTSQAKIGGVTRADASFEAKKIDASPAMSNPVV